MRIGLVTTSFPRFEGDIAGAFVLGFARALVSRGHAVRVLAPEAEAGEAPSGFEGIEVRWVAYVRPRSWSRTFYGAGVPDNLRTDPRAWLGLGPFAVALFRCAGEALAGCDALVSHWAVPCALAAGAVRGGRPHLAVLHSADVHALCKLPLGGVIARRVARSATALLFVSERQRDRFLALLPSLERARVAGQCHVSAMGIDPLPEGRSRREARRALGLERFTVLSMGRLVPIKGIDCAIEAVSAARCALGPGPSAQSGDGDGVELVVAGDGPERDRLERHAAARGARVRFVGLVTGAAKADLLRAADAFVLPSIETRAGRSEGLPTTLLEAMHASLPVVATDTGGIDTVVTHDRSGLLVPPDRPDALRAALARLRDDRSLRRRLARAGHNTAKRYLWAELAPHLEALLTPG